MSALAADGRTSLRVAPHPTYGIPKTPQIRAEVISRLRGVKVEGGWPPCSLAKLLVSDLNCVRGTSCFGFTIVLTVCFLPSGRNDTAQTEVICTQLTLQADGLLSHSRNCRERFVNVTLFLQGYHLVVDYE